MKCAYCDNECEEEDNINSKGQKICSDCFYEKTDDNNDLIKK